jgi:hypothetical protein
MSELAKQIRAQIQEKTAQRNALTKELLGLEHDLGLLLEANKRESKREKYYAWLAENDTENVVRYALWMQDDPDEVINALMAKGVPVRVVLKALTYVCRKAGEHGDRDAILSRVYRSREVVRLLNDYRHIVDDAVSEVELLLKGGDK